MAILEFSRGGVAYGTWDSEARTWGVSAQPEPSDETWVRLCTADDPAELVGASAYRCAIPGMRPVTIGGVTYPHAWAAAAAGVCTQHGPDVIVSAGTPVGGVGWSQIWSWAGSGWSAAAPA
jgi:hypothetical protein